jgi:hypothetical protein
LATPAASLERCYDVLEAPCARLSGDQRQAQSPCPDWDTRGVVTHLRRMERVMTGWPSASAEETPPLDRIAPYSEEVAALDDQAFAARVADYLHRSPRRHDRLASAGPGSAVVTPDLAAQLRRLPRNANLRLLGLQSCHKFSFYSRA